MFEVKKFPAMNQEKKKISFLKAVKHNSNVDQNICQNRIQDLCTPISEEVL